jgi:hypothetical protein
VNAKLAPKAEDAASAEPMAIASTNLLFVFTIVVVVLFGVLDRHHMDECLNGES